MIKVEAKQRRVDVTQRSEEDRAADRKLATEGAATVQTAGMNSLQAALARAGIQKKDFVDVSKVCCPAAPPPPPPPCLACLAARWGRIACMQGRRAVCVHACHAC